MSLLQYRQKLIKSAEERVFCMYLVPRSRQNWRILDLTRMRRRGSDESWKDLTEQVLLRLRRRRETGVVLLGLLLMRRKRELRVYQL